MISKVVGTGFGGNCHGSFGCMDAPNPSHIVPITGLAFQRLAPARPDVRSTAASAPPPARVAHRVAVWSPPGTAARRR